MSLVAQAHLLQDMPCLISNATRAELLMLTRGVHQRDAQVVEHRHADKRFGDLKATCQAQPGAAVRRLSADIASFKADLPFFSTQCPRDAVDQRAFARTVGTDQA